MGPPEAEGGRCYLSGHGKIFHFTPRVNDSTTAAGESVFSVQEGYGERGVRGATFA